MTVITRSVARVATLAATIGMATALVSCAPEPGEADNPLHAEFERLLVDAGGIRDGQIQEVAEDYLDRSVRERLPMSHGNIHYGGDGDHLVTVMVVGNERIQEEGTVEDFVSRQGFELDARGVDDLPEIGFGIASKQTATQTHVSMAVNRSDMTSARQ